MVMRIFRPSTMVKSMVSGKTQGKMANVLKSDDERIQTPEMGASAKVSGSGLAKINDRLEKLLVKPLPKVKNIQLRL